MFEYKLHLPPRKARLLIRIPANPAPARAAFEGSMTCSKEYQSLLEKKGVTLRDLGLRDVALKPEDTLAALAIMEKECIPVLGGDVYLERFGEYEPAYGSYWSIDAGENETPEDFLRRSWNHCRAYLQNFRCPPGTRPLFVLIVGDPAAQPGQMSGWAAQAAA